MQKLLIAVAGAALACGSAAASDRTDAMTVVHKWVDSFNKGDVQAANSTCADDAIVIDDFSPHVWRGCAKWYSDYEAFAAKGAVTNANVALGKTRHLSVESGYAYLVVPVALTYNKAGKASKEAGIVTMSLQKLDVGWRITGWAWADQ
jgi:ketosteroid isomerase-like protein